MRHSLIIAGGSGTRLWPMSRSRLPKQLIPLIDGKSLLEVACDRLAGFIPVDRQFICAGRSHQAIILERLGQNFCSENYLDEPMGRDTLNAVAMACAVIAQRDRQAVIGVFTADHVIRPVDRFQQVIEQGYRLVEQHPETLVTFGITPTHPATGYGYLELGQAIGSNSASQVSRFKEKPDQNTAQEYLLAGPQKYLWNSGMFVWSAATLLDCVKRYQPENHAGVMRIAQAWGTADRVRVLDEVYPTLKKISVDYAVMEPASRDAQVQVAALPMDLSWLDVGSWPSLAAICRQDESGNALNPSDGQFVTLDSQNNLLVSSDANHLIATVGVENLIVVHTAQATLVCRRDQAEQIKKLHEMIGQRLGSQWL